MLGFMGMCSSWHSVKPLPRAWFLVTLVFKIFYVKKLYFFKVVFSPYNCLEVSYIHCFCCLAWMASQSWAPVVLMSQLPHRGLGLRRSPLFLVCYLKDAFSLCIGFLFYLLSFSSFFCGVCESRSHYAVLIGLELTP